MFSACSSDVNDRAWRDRWRNGAMKCLNCEDVNSVTMNVFEVRTPLGLHGLK